MSSPRKTWRVARLVPWYHAPMPRCDVLTAKMERCVFSARYHAVERSTEVDACKVHADILALEGWKIKPLRAHRINI